MLQEFPYGSKSEHVDNEIDTEKYVPKSLELEK